MPTMSHFNHVGQAQMVDVGAKPMSQRTAVASGNIQMKPETLLKIREGLHGKGDVLGVARIAAIMGAKRTADLIPLCHPLALSSVNVDFTLDSEHHWVSCRAAVSSVGQTGVEMEALTAVQVGLLTIYDMCKAIDRGMCINAVRLLRKSGGKSGDWVADGE